MSKVVYVTGCLGFIGSYVTRACLEKGWHVFGIDKCTYASNLENLKESIDNFSLEGIAVGSEDEVRPYEQKPSKSIRTKSRFEEVVSSDS